jgi:1,4-alpha-glucan branching enzyme
MPHRAKHTLMKSKSKTNVGKQPQPQTLHIEFHDQRAQAVSIAGTFNEWHPQATPMIPLGEGRWVKELILPPGRYEYRLVVDDQWICDPAATRTVPNPYGGQNAVLLAGGAS